MAFVPGCNSDVFISYTRGCPLAGWSRALCEALTGYLNTYLSVRYEQGVKVWMDDGIKGNLTLKQIEDEDKGAAVLISVISQTYLDSEWCKREVDWFAESGEHKGRIFVVRCRSTDERDWPTPLKGESNEAIPGFWFFKFDRNAEADAFPFGFPVPKDSDDESRQSFFRELSNLAERVGQQLKEMKAARLKSQPQPQPPTVASTPARSLGGGTRKILPQIRSVAQDRPCIYLSVPTEDVAAEHDELRAKLEALGFAVIPEPEATDAQGAQAILEAPPPGCTDAAMVLGSMPGRLSRIAGEDHVIWQHKQILRVGMKPFIWQPPRITEAMMLDPAYCSLVQSLARDRSESAAEVAAKIQAALSQRPTGDQNGQRRFVFLESLDTQNPASADSGGAGPGINGEVRTLLEELNARVFPLSAMPLGTRDLAKLERYRLEMRRLKVDCDRIMLLMESDESPPDFWVLEIERDVKPKAAVPPRCAVLDATRDGSFAAMRGVDVIRYQASTLRDSLQKWLS